MSKLSVRSLSEQVKQQFAGTLILDRLIGRKDQIHASLLDKDDRLLEPILNYLQTEGILEINPDHSYQPTEKGRKAYEKLLQQQASYATHFDIYAYVDLEAGVFADKESDFLEEDRWEDLRVAVAQFKGIDAYRMVFFAMLSDETFYENPDWKFDLAMGTLFETMVEIVQSQLGEEDLGYQDGKDTISGHAVLQDIIEQGSKLNQERYQQRQSQHSEGMATSGDSQGGGDPNTETVITTVHYGYPYPYYDPWTPLAAYAASALFLEALWYDPYW